MKVPPDVQGHGAKLDATSVSPFPLRERLVASAPYFVRGACGVSMSKPDAPSRRFRSSIIDEGLVRATNAGVSVPIAMNGGLVIVKGNLCPEGAVIKIAGLTSLVRRRPARVFEDEEQAQSAVQGMAYSRARC